jgi:hypothetical protein
MGKGVADVYGFAEEEGQLRRAEILSCVTGSRGSSQSCIRAMSDGILSVHIKIVVIDCHVCGRSEHNDIGKDELKLLSESG